ncbi:ABC transporter substrate-binding protein [Trueperella pyogenes]|uniref:D-ribose ABC transporter substrate-binding protein n=1 Tax=Trueperella pyogenes TaxID=1661 RepID=UPI00043AE5E6|nr:D-ribose ABC transporter substrate-binding protein [Trueperella pyogenes]AHU90122.1 ABC transporter substrate-binding protein [Trueperella pyogenes]OQD32612.1 D-ribose ABC transporter substrate-binding protein [Trueperella pyogenes]
MLKKLTALAAAAAMAFTLTACNRDAQGENGTTSSATGDVVLLVSTLNNPFFVDLRDGAQAKADALGVKLQVQDAQNDASTQNNQIDNAIASGAGLVIINPVDSDAAGPGVVKLNDANIPVIAVDRGVTSGKLATFISSDNVAGGRQAAEELAKAIGEKGDVLVLQGIPGSSASRDRGQGFDEGIAAFTGIKVAAKQTANFDRSQGLDVTNNLLQANTNIKGIFAENDEMALGALEAIGSGSDIKVFGFDGTGDALTAIAADRMVGTIAQQPKELGALAVDAAAKILSGKTVDKEIPVKVVSVLKANVKDFQ